MGTYMAESASVNLGRRETGNRWCLPLGKELCQHEAGPRRGATGLTAMTIRIRDQA